MINWRIHTSIFYSVHYCRTIFFDTWCREGLDRVNILQNNYFLYLYQPCQYISTRSMLGSAEKFNIQWKYQMKNIYFMSRPKLWIIVLVWLWFLKSNLGLSLSTNIARHALSSSWRSSSVHISLLTLSCRHNELNIGDTGLKVKRISGRVWEAATRGSLLSFAA